ncbi:MAG: LytTR family DNA-binding domain-containing protein [Lachnospiraceae bacterium]
MKIKIEIDPQLTEDEITIRCQRMDSKIQQMQEHLAELSANADRFRFFQGEKECYLKLDSILFFETTDKIVCAHTKNESFTTAYRLYELEEILPGNFMRISKSAILNTEYIYSITKSITASSLVEFCDSYKQVYVSRYYYKPLTFKLEERRRIYEK